MKQLDHPWIDESEWPLLRLTYPEDAQLGETTEMLAAVRAFYARNTKPFAWVVDASQTAFPDAKARRVTAEHETLAQHHLRLFNCGTAFVIPSTFVRGVLTAIFWLSPPQYPHDVFSTLDPARDWALERLRLRTCTSQRPRVSGW
jgi:hypothetical protein